MSPARRARLRARLQATQAAQADAVTKLRAQHARCGNCRHRDRRGGRVTCALDDDGPWFQPVTLDHLCHRWEAKP